MSDESLVGADPQVRPAAGRDQGSGVAEQSPTPNSQPPTPHLQCSLIMTVRNEAGSITGVLDSLRGQTRAPDEVVIADGGSTDGTAGLIRAYAAQAPWPL